MPEPLIIPCPVKSNCECQGNPVPNYSSEAPDRHIFFSMNWGWGTTNGPNPGDLYTNPNGFYICVDTNSQDDADICAAAGEIQNEVDGGGSDPGDRTDPNGNHYFLYGNNQQVCSRDCGDGTHFTYTIAAGRVNALSQILADRIANSLACNLANKYAICISNISGACLGDEYDQLITATTQTTGDIDWSLRSGMLPPGIEFLPDLFNTRQISLFGTPTVPGNYVFTIRATDRFGNFTDKTFTLAVIGFTNSPTQATVNSAYSFQFHATGGTGPYTFSVPAGHLPTGLSMNSSGVISGTPTDSTPTTFTVTVEDSLGNQCQEQFTMTPSNNNCATIIAALAWAATGSATPTTGANPSINLTATGFQNPSGTLTANITNNTGAAFDITVVGSWSGTQNHVTSGSTTNALYDGGSFGNANKGGVQTWGNEVYAITTVTIPNGETHQIQLTLNTGAGNPAAAENVTSMLTITCT